MKKSKIDATDEKIIKLLDRDVRQTYEVLAKNLNMSPLTIRRRMNKITAAAASDSNRTRIPLEIRLSPRLLANNASTG